MVIIGIDPGLTGAIAFLTATGAFVAVHDLPLMESEKKTGSTKHRLNPSALATLIGEHVLLNSVMAYVEIAASHPDQGRSSIFSFGRTYGSIEGVLGAKQIPIRYVSPMVWKKFYGFKGKDKEQARRLAIEKFPMAPLEKKLHHNRAEALLLAAWACQTQQPHQK